MKQKGLRGIREYISECELEFLSIATAEQSKYNEDYYAAFTLWCPC